MNLTLQRYHICIAVVKHFSVYFHGRRQIFYPSSRVLRFAFAYRHMQLSASSTSSVFSCFLNAVACLENIGDKFLLLYYNMNNIIIKFSLCIKVWHVFKLKTDDIDDGLLSPSLLYQHSRQRFTLRMLSGFFLLTPTIIITFVKIIKRYYGQYTCTSRRERMLVHLKYLEQYFICKNI